MLELFLAFSKVGLFTFGGGYAMIAIIEELCVEEKKWLTSEEMMELIVIAESTPGPMAINCATYVGYRQKGLWGAAAATFGMVLPSFVIIYAISLFLDGFLEIPVVANAFRGIRVSVAVLILNAGWKMKKKLPKGALTRGLLLFGFAAMLVINLFALKISTIALMVFAGAVSLAAALRKGGVEK